MTLDTTKQMQTRDGRDVVIYCTDADSACPIQGRVLAGNQLAESWTKDGVRFNSAPYGDGWDLINKPEEVVRWLPCLTPLNLCLTRQEAENAVSHDVLGLWRITYVEGRDPVAVFVPRGGK